MRVSTGYMPQVYQQQRTNTGHAGFADLYAGWAESPEEAETPANAVSTGLDVQKAYEEAAAQTAGVRSNIESPNNLTDFAKSGWDIFCRMYDVDTARPLNEDSLGDKELTPEQIAMLKEKYDVNNLTAQERYDLFCELTDIGVLSADDVRLTNVGNIFTMTKGVLVKHPESGYDRLWYFNIPKNDFASYMMAWVEQEQSAYNYMAGLGSKYDELEDYEQRNYRNFQNNIQNIDYLTASHQKVANVLSQLVRG